MSFVADLKWSHRHRPCFQSRTHNCRLLALHFTTDRLSSPCAILIFADHTTPSLPVKILMIRPSLYSKRFTVLYTRHSNWPFFRFCTCSIWSVRYLVPLWKVYANPSFPDSVSIGLSRFEEFSQVMVAFTGWHEWSTRVFFVLARSDLV